jgi:hypothetical protein
LETSECPPFIGASLSRFTRIKWSQNRKIAKAIHILWTVKANKTVYVLFHSEEKDVKALPPSGSEVVVDRADRKAWEPVVSGEIVQV